MITEGIDRASDLIESTISVAITKKEKIVKQFINILLLFIILMVFGCLDFATLTFHYEYLLSANYWGTVGTKVIAGVCAFNLGINFIFDSEVKKNGILQEAIAKNKQLMAYKQIDFEYYVIKVFNLNEKRKAYISYINRKINLLNRFSRAKDRLLYSSTLSTEEEKQKNFYCRRRKELEQLKTDEYIEKNIESINVKYYEVDPSIFELEIDGSAKTQGVRTRGSVNQGRVKASSTVIIGMILISSFFTAFGLEADSQEFQNNMVAFWHYCLKAIQDIGVVLWQFARGMFESRKIVSQQLTEPYLGRNKVLESYLEWRLTTNQPDSLVYKELHQEEEIIEITEDDLNKLKEE